MDIEKIEELGVSDYYFDLTKYINNFVNTNYPLSKDDFRSMLTAEREVIEQDGILTTREIKPMEPSLNMKRREAIFNLMKSEVEQILNEKMKGIENEFKLVEYNNGKPLEKNVETYSQELVELKQRILEKVWNFRSSSELFNTSLMKVEKETIKNSIEEGISAEAVNSTIGDIINKANEIGTTPQQTKEVVETIVEMKKNTNNVVDESYASNFVKQNNEKIKSAINDGLTSEEITATLVETTNKANDKKGKKHLKFVTKLISKMKQKELKLLKQNEQTMEKGIQKVFIK